MTAVKKKIRKTDLILINLTNYIADIFTMERGWQLAADVNQHVIKNYLSKGCDQLPNTLYYVIPKLARLLYLHQVIINNDITDKMVIKSRWGRKKKVLMLECKLSVVDSGIININNSIVKRQCDSGHILAEQSDI